MSGPDATAAGPGGPTGAPLTLGVVVVTYKRLSDLASCLDGLSRLRRLPDEVVVTVHADDAATAAFMAARPAGVLPVRMIPVPRSGIVAARNAALEASTTDIVAFIDDDTVPHPDWSERIQSHFERDPRLGGLGGKDRLHDGTSFNDQLSDVVGHISWYGRVVPNQHLGHGAPREVDMVKGANMSFRRAAIGAIRFDTRLKGRGAQPNDDLAFGLEVRRTGWTLLYDPAVLVDHFSGKRQETRHYATVAAVTDQRGYKDFAYNEVVALWDELSPSRRVAFVAWSFLVGTRVCPGVVQAIRFTPRLGRASWQRFSLAQQGKLEGLRGMRKSRPPNLMT